ncbi:MAG TPA: mechanosensitive ion channel family protein [Anaerolineales bacterium]|nr:mechanosensitive ion channel family protein [Anaerolineales bacterium]
MEPFTFRPMGDLNQYLPALIAFAASFIIIGSILKFSRDKARAISYATRSGLSDTVTYAMGKLNLLFVLALSIFIAARFINLKQPWHTWVNSTIYIIIAFYIIRLSQTFLVYSVEKAFKSKDQNLSAGLKIVINIAIWFLGGALILQHFGYDVSALIAGMGIGGIAIAFALQSILADIFSSFSIYFDKPFEIGDSIMVGQDQGTVKKIGIKSTRITTLQGEELVIPNSELTTARIHNFKQMDERRAVIKLGVPYQTPIDKLEMVKQIITEAIAAQPMARLEYVHLASLAADQIVFEAVFFVESKDFLTFAGVNEKVNFSLLERFSAERIHFATPTQRIFLSERDSMS